MFRPVVSRAAPRISASLKAPMAKRSSGHITNTTENWMPSQETASKSPKLWMLGYASFCVIGFFSPFWVANYQLRKQQKHLWFQAQPEEE